MTKTLIILVAVLINLLLIVGLAATHGLAYLTIPPWTIALPLWLLWLLCLIIMLLYRCFWQLLCHIWQLPQNIRLYWSKLKQRRHEKNLLTGLIASQMASWADAEQNLINGCDKHTPTAINYLFAAQAAYQQGAWECCRHYLGQITTTSPQLQIASAALQIKVALAQQQYQQALNQLASTSQSQPYQPLLPQLVIYYTQQAMPWEQLLALLPLVAQHKIAKRQNLAAINKVIYIALLKQAPKQQITQQQLLKLWHNTPQQLRLDPELLAKFVQLLLHEPNTIKEFELLIRKLLSQSWQPSLVLCYGLLPADASHQLKFITACYKQYGRNALLLLSAGRLASRCELWGQAKTYLLESLNKEARADTNLALAALFTKLGEERLALSYYQAASQYHEQFYQANL